MDTFRTVLSGSLVFAYLLIGSGYHIENSPKPDPKRDTVAFAATLPRKVYRYSVVPGGVFTPDELLRARRNDPVVAAHFADFGTNTTVTTLKEDMYVYVSYRKGDKIYYSKKKHKVCKGEVVLTDGKNYARTRCANRLSKIFRPPALSFDEPTAPQFDYIEPPSAPDVVSGDPLAMVGYPGLPDGSNYAPPSQQAQSGANPGPPEPVKLTPGPLLFPTILPVGAFTPALFIPPTPRSTPPPVVVVPPVVVPEPADWPIVLAFVAALPLLSLMRKKKPVVG